MNSNNKKYRFIKCTCSWATKRPSWLDWIRGIYFAVFGAALLQFGLRLYNLSSISILLFIIGIFFLLIGIWSSGEIANRFRKYEKEHDKQPQETMTQNTSDVFFYQKETTQSTSLKLIRLQHFSFYFIGIVALLIIGISVAIEEKKNAEMKDLVRKNENLTQQKDSLIQIISKDEIETKFYQDSLHTAAIKLDLQEKQIDSLENVIRFFNQKTDNREIKGKGKNKTLDTLSHDRKF